ncbi:MAG: hypothetical protein SFU85_08675 [Candidatus Methylacidiphilales bacterium]|nr:hypothetical protein [Candidatus Methylacidiphilales bacterium]
MVLAQTGHSAPVGDLPMPDLLVLTPGAALPAGVEGPEIRCLIVEETATSVRVDLSSFRGIRQVVEVPRASVQRLERGDPSLRPWFEISKSLAWPPHSRRASFYEGPVRLLKDFLDRYPQSPNQAEADREWRRWSGEGERVRQGHFRVRERWFQPSELDETDRRAWALWQTLPEDQVPPVPEDWTKIASDLAGQRSSRFYPAIVEDFRRALGQRRLQFPEVFKDVKIDEAVGGQNLGPLWQVWNDLNRWEGAQEGQLPGRDGFLNDLQKGRGLWPELRWIDTLLEATLSRVRSEVEKSQVDGRLEEGTALLQNWAKALDILQKGDGQRKWTDWFAAALQQLQTAQTLVSVEAMVKAGDWSGVESALQSLLARPEAAQMPVYPRLLEIRKLLAEYQAGRATAELTAWIREKKYDILLEACGDRRRKMETNPGEWESARQQQADLLVEAAGQTLHEKRLWTAWKLVMEAWRTQPGNLKAQMAVTLGAAGAFLLLLLAAVPVLLLYAWLSNRIDMGFFRHRLQIARQEEERQQRKLREMGQKQDPQP